MRSLARAGPTSLGRRWVPPAPGMMPRSISGCPIRASSAANRKSAHMASSHAPPSAYPVMAAMVTTGRSSTALKTSWRCWMTGRISAGPMSTIILTSAPAAKTFSPPQITQAPTSSRAAASSATSASSRVTRSLMASMGGRSSRMVATPSSTSRRTNSPMGLLRSSRRGSSYSSGLFPSERWSWSEAPCMIPGRPAMQSKTLRTLVTVMVIVLVAPLAAEAFAHALRWSPQGSEGRPRAARDPAKRAQKHLRLEAYRGLGAWIDIYDGGTWRHPGRAVRGLHRRGVRTIFLQTTNYGSRGPIRYPGLTARFLRAAHRLGLHVVGWYVPDFVHPRRDLRRSLAAIRFRSRGGHGFDSFALDIEANILPPGRRTRRLLRLSRAIRRAAGRRYPLRAITPSPRGMEL